MTTEEKYVENCNLNSKKKIDTMTGYAKDIRNEIELKNYH
jgi:hypothetical protein